MNKLERFKQIIEREPKDDLLEFLFQPKVHFQKLIDDIEFLDSLKEKND